LYLYCFLMMAMNAKSFKRSSEGGKICLITKKFQFRDRS
jgi:hypothetical protein